MEIIRFFRLSGDTVFAEIQVQIQENQRKYGALSDEEPPEISLDSEFGNQKPDPSYPQQQADCVEQKRQVCFPQTVENTDQIAVCV